MTDKEKKMKKKRLEEETVSERGREIGADMETEWTHVKFRE